MQSPTERLAGYSDFFASGFQAALNRSSINQHLAERKEQSPSSLHRVSVSYKRSAPRRSRGESFMEFSSTLGDKLSAPNTNSRRVPRTPPRSSPVNVDVWITRGESDSCSESEHDDPTPGPRAIGPSSQETESIFITSPRKSRDSNKPESFFNLSDASRASFVSPTPQKMRRRKSMPHMATPIPLDLSTQEDRDYEEEEEREETWTMDLDHWEQDDDDEEGFTNRIDWRQFYVDVLLGD